MKLEKLKSVGLREYWKHKALETSPYVWRSQRILASKVI